MVVAHALLIGGLGYGQSNNSEPKKLFLAVNGGGCPSENLSHYELDLYAVWDGLFRKQGEYLNAGGTGTRVATWSNERGFDRDRLGEVILKPSFLTFSTLAATIENLEKRFDVAKQSGAQEATIVFSGPGIYPGKVSLWEKNTVDFAELERLQAKLGSQTLIRRLHLHGHSGSFVANPSRLLPKNSEDLASFFEKFYTPNFCALGVSGPDEEAYGVEGSWEKRNEYVWRRIFSELQTPSLKNLKTRLGQDPLFISTPILTSDVFVEDVVRVICRSRAGNKRQPGPIVPFCKDYGTQATEMDATLEKASGWLDEVRVARNRFIEQFLLQREPELWKSYSSAAKELDSFVAAHWQALAKTSGQTKSDAAFDYAKWEKLRQKMLPFEQKFASLYYGVGDQKAFRHFVDQMGSDQKKQFQQEKKFVPFPFTKPWLDPALWQKALSTVNRARLLRKEQLTSFLDLSDELRAEVMTLQFARKQAALRFRYRARVFVERHLQQPTLESVRKIYESIQDCENSTIN